MTQAFDFNAYLKSLTDLSVGLPSLLFFLLSPGIMALPGALRVSGRNPTIAMHALVMMLLLWAWYHLTNKPYNNNSLFVPALLFIALTPGVLLSIPPGGGRLFMSGSRGTRQQIMVHTLIFSVVYFMLKEQYPAEYIPIKPIAPKK